MRPSSPPRYASGLGLRILDLTHKFVKNSKKCKWLNFA
jgi:hypothetical protein